MVLPQPGLNLSRAFALGRWYAGGLTWPDIDDTDVRAEVEANVSGTGDTLLSKEHFTRFGAAEMCTHANFWALVNSSCAGTLLTKKIARTWRISS